MAGKSLRVRGFTAQGSGSPGEVSPGLSFSRGRWGVACRVGGGGAALKGRGLGCSWEEPELPQRPPEGALPASIAA